MNKIAILDELLLIEILQLPPEKWLKKCKTSDQINHWEEQKTFYGLMYMELSAYFSGKPSPFSRESKESEYYWASKKIEYLIYLLTKRYIDLYNLIRSCWDYLNVGEWSYKDKSRKLIKYEIPAEPGYLLIAILKQECAIGFDQCLAYHEYRPHLLYNLYSQDKKIRELIELETKRSLTGPEKNTIKNFDYKVSKLLDQSQLSLYWLVLQVAKSNKENMIIKNELKTFETTLEDLDKLIHAPLRPNRNPKSYNWHNGVKKPLS
jgi:hypothetical protein